jgi:hypothetical protein
MMGSGEGNDAGLIPRICNSLFSFSNQSKGSHKQYKIEASYIEIYAERIRDLLGKSSSNSSTTSANRGAVKELKIREHPTKGPYVEGLTICAVKNYSQLEQLIKLGNSERTVAATNMNAESSRSHAVVTIIFTTTTYDELTKLSSDVISNIQLVDLAGSERVETTGATGIRLKEAANINKSLTTLGRVISSLAARSEGESNPSRRKTSAAKGLNEEFIPFRDSVLTYLLKESLGGNAKTIMLACVSPADVNYEETLSTLKYAARAKNIVNKAIVNEDSNAALIRNLRDEIESLKSKLTEVQLTTSPAVILPANSEIEKLRLELEEEMKQREAEWQKRLLLTQQQTNNTLNHLQSTGMVVGEINPLAPYLVNLNPDPALSETLRFELIKGNNIIGTNKVNQTNDSSMKRIVLSGLSVAADHCIIINEKHAKFTIQSISNNNAIPSNTYINGQLLQESRELLHADRILIGSNHFFKFSLPESQLTPAMKHELSSVDYSTAQQEVTKSLGINKIKSSGSEAIIISEEEYAELQLNISADDYESSEDEQSIGLSSAAPNFHFDGGSNNNDLFNSEHSSIFLPSLTEFQFKLSRIVEHSQFLCPRGFLRLVENHNNLMRVNSPFNSSIPCLRVFYNSVLYFQYNLLYSYSKTWLNGLLFLCDEANAICTALGRSNRYRLLLTPFHYDAVAMIHNSNDQVFPFFSNSIGLSPLYRLRRLSSVVVTIIEYMNHSSVPFNFLNRWDSDAFYEFLLVLREDYNSTLEANTLNNAENHALSSIAAFPNRVTCIGHGLFYLFGLNYTLSQVLTLPAIDYKGEIIAFIKVAIEIVKANANNNSMVQDSPAVVDAVNESDFSNYFNQSSEDYDLLPVDCNNQNNSSRQELGLFIRIISVDTSILFNHSNKENNSNTSLYSAGCESLAISYRLPHIQHNFHTSPLSTRHLSASNPDLHYNYSSLHKFQPNTSMGLKEFLCEDAISFNLIAKFQAPNSKSSDNIDITSPVSSVKSASRTLVTRKASVEILLNKKPSYHNALTPNKDYSVYSTKENMIFACVDIEEDYEGSFIPCVYKLDSDNSPCFKLTQGKSKRFIISLLQADQANDFIIESLASMQITKVTRNKLNESSTSGNNNHAADKSKNLPSHLSVSVAPSSLHPYELIPSTAHSYINEKLLVASVQWSEELLHHNYLHSSTQNKERIQLYLQLTIYCNRTSQSIVIPYNLHIKVYNKVTNPLNKSAAKSSSSPIVSSDNDRLAHLGAHYSVSRIPNTNSNRAVFNEFKRTFNRIHVNLRKLQIEQYEATKRNLVSTGQDKAAKELEKGFNNKLDSYFNVPKIDFASVMSDLQLLNNSITILVRPIQRKVGTRSALVIMKSVPNNNAHKLEAQKGLSVWISALYPYIFIYEHREQNKETSIIHLFQAKISSHSPDSFTIVTNTHTHLIQTGNANDTKQWINQLQIPQV